MMGEWIITIDGPAGSGKGTIGQRLAVELGWRFLDSGALYRCCAYLIFKNSLAEDDADGLLRALDEFEFESVPGESGHEAKVLLNGEDLSLAIRTAACGQMASRLAIRKDLRRRLLVIQRQYYRPPGLVADGRDMGTVVFPNALLKVFLTADIAVRAQRKFKQLKEKEISLNYDKIYREIENRDLRDSTRRHAPLMAPKGALTVDTSSLSVNEVLQCVLNGVHLKRAELESASW